MSARSIRYLLGVVVVTALAGCASFERYKRTDGLETSLTTYYDSIKWGRYGDASLYRVPRGRTVQTIDADSLKGLHVTTCDIVDKQMNEMQTEAVVRAEIGYYDDATNTAHSSKDEQIWYYDEQQERWFLDGDLPNFLLLNKAP